MTGTAANLAPACPVGEGDLLWTPSPERVERTALAAFLRWLAAERDLAFPDYPALWRWSAEHPDEFWRAVWDYFDVAADGDPSTVLDAPNGFAGARWFPGVRTNYAEHLLRYERSAKPGEPALLHASETRPMTAMDWPELGRQVRAVAGALRRLGIGPGDRVASYMPNIAETAVAMLATVAIGAVWAAAAPEFGAETVIDRFGQIEPRLIFAADGYSFNGTRFDRREELGRITAALPSLEHLVWLPYLGTGGCPAGAYAVSQFAALVDGPAETPATFQYERVASDAPLWVLFSSGTTGLPKAIVHGHAGMIVEQMKSAALHLDLAPGKRLFFYTTTGWMMWNSLFAALSVGAAAVLFDGSPVHGGPACLWRLAEQAGATHFGASPTLVQIMKRTGVVPARDVDVRSIDTVILGGAPATPDVFAWFYEAVGPDLFVVSSSGGTELASALVGAVPIQPVHAGEMQGRCLGMAVEVWNDEGAPVLDEVGELVVTRPFPTAPLRFWNDPDGRRYHDSYFTTFPGVWRHGDLAKLNGRGGVYVYGRSDSTLNRFGVRIGTAEIYNVLAGIAEIADSLIVCCETPDGGHYMPLFVALAPAIELDGAVRDRIAGVLRNQASPRHVPDEIIAVPGVPYTLTGKKMEVPVRRIVMGVPPEEAASRESMAKPALLDWVVAFAAQPSVRSRFAGADASV